MPEREGRDAGKDTKGVTPVAGSATIVNCAAPEKISAELATAKPGPSTSSAAAP